MSNKLKKQITLMHENSIVKINYFYKLIIDIKLENINFNDKSVSSFIYIHLQVYKFINYVTYNWSISLVGGLTTLPDLVVVVVEGCMGGDDGAGCGADGENTALVGMLKTLFANCC